MDDHYKLEHPDSHLAASRWHEDQTLHVAWCYINPFRYRTRREITNHFKRQLRQPNVKAYGVEIAFGDRPFEVTHHVNRHEVQLRTRHTLWLKENALRIAISHFPPNWKYGAIVDADFLFTRHDWALEAIHQLQMYDWVQLFSSVTYLSGHDLGRGHRPIDRANSFMYLYVNRGFRLPAGYTQGGWRDPTSGAHRDKHREEVGAPGGAWAFRREAYDAVGGLMDRCILGSADHFTAFGLVGGHGVYHAVDKYTDEYRKYILAWQKQAATLDGNIGYVDCHAVHHHHGRASNRGYGTRDKILIGNQYSPVNDVHPDWQGVLQLTRGKPKMRDQIRQYFLSRSEDYPQDS